MVVTTLLYLLFAFASDLFITYFRLCVAAQLSAGELADWPKLIALVWLFTSVVFGSVRCDELLIAVRGALQYAFSFHANSFGADTASPL